MSSAAIALPPVVLYPERRAGAESALERLALAAEAALLARATSWRARRLAPIVERVAREGDTLVGLDDAGLARAARAVGTALRRDQHWPAPLVARSFAIIREAAARRLGQRHHDVQLIGGYALLRGMMAEMGTGEGKTLAATLAAATAALAGVPVHVITVNSYLAERDAAALSPLYEFLGVSVGVVTERVDPAGRAAAYRCDVTYCTNKDVAFDYMRDRLRLGRRMGNLRRKAARLGGGALALENSLLRGLHFAIVDEADSVLIDEARTPLILSGSTGTERDPALFEQALALAGALRLGTDYTLIANERRVQLLERGRERLEKEASQLGSPWDEIAERERLIGLALTALHLLRRDEHYLVREDKAEIIDEYTGRILPDRTWTDGLQEMIERKEGLKLSDRRATTARMTYQRFFRRYRRLAGMTGTAREVVEELWRVYRLPVASIPPHRPSRRMTRPIVGHRDNDAKWRAILGEVAAVHRTGAPVLIGTRTVAESARASARLGEAGLAHVVLNAAQDAAEADIVARAGRSGAITVATNMAGRGTDIRPDATALASGGLHVFMSELHEAARIDRQLAGRTARQGEPGAVHGHVSLEDAIVERHCPRLLALLARLFSERLGSGGVAAVTRLAQYRAERLHARMRRELLKSDQWVGDATAFVGEQE
jgi:preprotein translocase subunit SecA